MTRPTQQTYPRSLDDYVIRQKTWRYLNARGEQVSGGLINLHRPGVLVLED